jgi:hypothetical protein
LNPSTESWNEFTVTWEDKPRAFSGAGEAIIKSNVEFAEWDVTELVQEWVNGEKDNHGLLLFRPVETNEGIYTFWSREIEDEAPRLIVEYQP